MTAFSCFFIPAATFQHSQECRNVVSDLAPPYLSIAVGPCFGNIVIYQKGDGERSNGYDDEKNVDLIHKSFLINKKYADA